MKRNIYFDKKIWIHLNFCHNIFHKLIEDLSYATVSEFSARKYLPSDSIFYKLFKVPSYWPHSIFYDIYIVPLLLDWNVFSSHDPPPFHVVDSAILNDFFAFDCLVPRVAVTPVRGVIMKTRNLISSSHSAGLFCSKPCLDVSSAGSAGDFEDLL